MLLDVECIDEWAAAPTGEEWARLQAAAGTSGPFLSRAFQQAWWEAFCRCASCPCQLQMLLLRDGGTLAGVAPFYLSRVTPDDLAEEQRRAGDQARIAARARVATEEPAAAVPAGRTARTQDGAAPPAAEPPALAPRLSERVVRLGGGVAVADYLGLIAPPGREPEAWAAVFGYWAAHAGDWDVLDLHALPRAAGTAEAVAQAAAAQGWAVWHDVEETCPALVLPGDWEAYLEALSKKDRHELRRKLRRSESLPEPPTYRLYTEGPDLLRGLEELLALLPRSGPAKARFLTPAMVAFFRSLLPAFGASGGLEVAVLYAGAHPAAAGLAFRDGARLLLYNSGYDPEYGGGGAGFTLSVYRIRQAIAQGIRVLDFLRGDERYKYDLGAVDHFIDRVIVRPA